VQPYPPVAPGVQQYPTQQYPAQPYPGVQPYPGAPGAAANRPWSVTAFISFGVGVIVLLISIFSSYAIAAALPIILGIVAIRETASKRKRGLPFAIIGVVCGGIALVIYLLNLVLSF
jgi:hypothetical protein